jgi:DNA-binding Xre family transcriptional regulator
MPRSRSVAPDGALLCREMARRGLTATALAAASGVSHRAIKVALNGGRVDLRTLEALGMALDQIKPSPSLNQLIPK